MHSQKRSTREQNMHGGHVIGIRPNPGPSSIYCTVRNTTATTWRTRSCDEQRQQQLELPQGKMTRREKRTEFIRMIYVLDSSLQSHAQMRNSSCYCSAVPYCVVDPFLPFPPMLLLLLLLLAWHLTKMSTRCRERQRREQTI